jgi:hypothetical protein
MRSDSSTRPPRVGDTVGIKGTEFIGTVLAIAGSSANPLFILDIHAPHITDSAARAAAVAVAMRIPRIYWLSLLEPGRGRTEPAGDQA